MAWNKKVDANQKQIVENLRKLGCSVRSTATIGKDFPDIIVGVAGMNFIFEIKDPAKKYSKLKPGQELFQETWRGQVETIWTTEQAVEIIKKAKAERNK